jgi:hypothetical protein
MDVREHRKPITIGLVAFLVFVLLALYAVIVAYRDGRKRETALWKRADALATTSDPDDLTMGITRTMHDLAGVFGAPTCSPVVLRTTQRFLPTGMTFDAEHLRKIEAGEKLPSVRLVTAGDTGPGASFECK